MAFIDTIPPAEAGGETRTMYLRQQQKYGYVPNYAKVFGQRPEVMRCWAELLAAIRRPVSAERFEMVTLTAAHELRNSPCALAHAKALQQFRSEAEVIAIGCGDAPGTVSDADAAMLSFARKVARDAAAITRDDVTTLLDAGFSDADIFDIAAVAAARAFFTKVLDALGVEPDIGSAQASAAMQRAFVRGRAIATAANECCQEASPADQRSSSSSVQ